MQKEKKRFSRQSTADLSTPAVDPIKDIKIQRKQRPNIPKPPSAKKELLTPFLKEESIISHLTKRSLFDRKSSQSSDSRAKSVAVKYIGSYKQPGVFGLNDKQFVELYKNDPFAKYKIDYVLKKNDEKIKKDKGLAATVNVMNMSKQKDITIFMDNSFEKVQEHKSGKSFVRCKSQSNLIQAAQCEHYKQLIVTHSQAYSGCTV